MPVWCDTDCCLFLRPARAFLFLGWVTRRLVDRVPKPRWLALLEQGARIAAAADVGAVPATVAMPCLRAAACRAASSHTAKPKLDPAAERQKQEGKGGENKKTLNINYSLKISWI